MTTKSNAMRRRSILASLSAGLIGTYRMSWAQPAVQKVKPKNPPVWTGFGLNGGAAQARYDLSRAFVRQQYKVDLADSEAFQFMIRPLHRLLADQHAGTVQFKNSVEFGEDLLLGFVHDYETTVGARVKKTVKTQTHCLSSCLAQA